MGKTIKIKIGADRGLVLFNLLNTWSSRNFFSLIAVDEADKKVLSELEENLKAHLKEEIFDNNFDFNLGVTKRKISENLEERFWFGPLQVHH